jgi:archaellum component FlaC
VAVTAPIKPIGGFACGIVDRRPAKGPTKYLLGDQYAGCRAVTGATCIETCGDVKVWSLRLTAGKRYTIIIFVHPSPRLTKAKDEALQANTQATELRKQAGNAKSELEAGNTQRDAVQNKLAEVTSDLENLKSELQEKQSRLDALQSEITGATQASDQAKSEVAKANDQSNAIQSKLDQANAEIERLRTQLAEAKAALSNENPQPAPSESPEAQPPAEVPPTPPAPSTNEQ